MPEFYIIIDRKNIFTIFWEVRAPCPPPSPTPVISLNERSIHFLEIVSLLKHRIFFTFPGKATKMSTPSGLLVRFGHNVRRSVAGKVIFGVPNHKNTIAPWP